MKLFSPFEKRAGSQRLEYGVLLGSLALGGLAVAELRRPWALGPEGRWLWLLLIAAGLVGGWSLRRIDQWLPEAQPPPQPAEPGAPVRRRSALVCLAAATALAVWVVVKLWPDYGVWDGAVGPWLAALLLTMAGGWLLGGIGRPDPGPRASRGMSPEAAAPDDIPRWLAVTGFVVIALLAVFVRLYRLKTIPSGIYVDETNAALDALYLLEGRHDSPFGTRWYQTPMGYIYYMAALFKVFGANYYSLKAASLIPAILTVLAIYPLGRLMFGRVAALAAMLFMAVSRWHLTMSRWGWNETAPPLFQILATFFLLRGLRDRRALDFSIGGLLTGLVVYTYLGSRLVVATLVLFSLYWVASDPEGPIRSLKRYGWGFALFFLAAVIAVAPIGVTYVKNPFTFWNRVGEISVLNEVDDTGSYEPLYDNIRRHLKFFHQAGDQHGKHNLPGEPELDPVTGLLFVVGLGHGLLRLRDRRRALLLMWVLIAMAAGVLSIRYESPQAYRTINAIPAIALLAGDVLSRLARGALRLRRPGTTDRTGSEPTGRILAVAIVLAGLAAAAVWEIGVYFGRQADSTAVQASFNLAENYVSREAIVALEEGTSVYLSTRLYEFSPLRFLVYGVVKARTGENSLENPPYRLARPDTDLPVPQAQADALFLLDTKFWSLRDYFMQFYPSADYRLVRGPGGEPLYMRIHVPLDQLAGLQGLNAHLVYRDGRVEERIDRTVDAEALLLDSAAWTGGVRIDQGGEYDFLPEGGLEILVDGETWTGPRFLGRGLHSLNLSLPPGRVEGPVRLGWKTPEKTEDVVPAEALFRMGGPKVGFRAAYFRNTRWAGEPLFRQITPFLQLSWNDGDPIPGPFSARFTGTLKTTTAGMYAIRLEADDGARLTIDGAVAAEGLVPDQPNTLHATVQLSPGDHPIKIEYFQNRGGSALELYWQPPGQEETPIPPTAVVPAPE